MPDFGVLQKEKEKETVLDYRFSVQACYCNRTVSELEM